MENHRLFLRVRTKSWQRRKSDATLVKPWRSAHLRTLASFCSISSISVLGLRGRGMAMVLPLAGRTVKMARNLFYGKFARLPLSLGSRSLGTPMHKPLKNRQCLSRDGTIWACVNLQDGVKIIDFPLVSARHTERSGTHATHWSRHRSPSLNTDEFSRGPNQEVRFFMGLGTRAVRSGPEGP
jgi:hypothetical protein